ncbi:MAG: DNA repair protein RecO [Candidatus Latescibacterota bacterium]
MGLCSTRAVVSNTMRMSGSSKLVTLITERYGLVKVMAKGARRPTSRFGAALEPVTFADVIYYKKENREIQTLSSAEIIEDYANIKSDLRSLCAASVMVEATQTVTALDDPSSGTIQVLLEGLDSLERNSGRDLEKQVWRFLLRLTVAAGYRPTLDRCIVCGKKPSATTVFFSYTDGGLVCSCSDTGERYGFWISPGSLMVMKSLLRAGAEELHRINVGPRQRREIEYAVLQFIAFHTGSSRTPRSISFLKKLDAYEKAGDRIEAEGEENSVRVE